ncbi:NAD-dependent epimerase/dehydratase family protein [Mycolicibacterium tokaiense]|uniref:NAD dependent epimerase/dehydratase family n=1 Tax=Mycolicibacterium tokaiense TaxID=39695 RepID=A0A378TEZ6_9MYCO|nr:NAD-dependent epimerase/dehydratase family protein [Mycolicibacterium tokaiense]BBY86739.1 NAD-dependent epimerase [Mycolicibacterium tokaiense]STZ58757.1 NAD dependent epimerase/dehydratase family [Mycolicibacterium tokaiense]
MSETTVVLGAGSGLGAEIARQLSTDGRPVRGVTRTGKGLPPGVENHRTDVMDREALIAACHDAAVIHMAANVPYPEWVASFPVMIDNVIAAAEATGAKVVFADNLYAYGPVTGPITEQTPQRPVGPKERMRADLGHTLLAAHERGRMRVTIGRISDYYGPDARMSLPGELIVGPLSRGRRPMWFAPLGIPHTFGYSSDTARALIILGDDARADGQIWHTPAAETLTIAEFIRLTGRVAGRERHPLRLPAATVRLLGLLDPRLRGYDEMDHQRTHPWVVDHAKFDGVFGPLPVTDHETALAETVRWYRAT